MSTTDSSLPSSFHPILAEWFEESIGTPTEVQAEAWPRIASGEHVLVTAPTGSGKTLTAFLWALNQLISGAWETGSTRVLYVSPLRALNNDIQRNLLVPLRELKDYFSDRNETIPDIRVLTRSGDTAPTDRRRMLRHPPEILITTPESLNLLLSSIGGRTLLRNLSTVILDEIHAVVGNKRGVHLITAVERLVPLFGEFQRIALSATVRPLQAVAEFVGGFTMEGSPPDPTYKPRPVNIVSSTARKRYQIKVRFPDSAREKESQDSIWDPLVEEFKKVIVSNRSTLLFTNNRALCEKLTLKINHGEEALMAYSHHGSLSREIREEVEGKLKSGELKAIVATNSLEMGIDIGALDEVVLVQSPPAVSSAVQRVGRAGHQVGEVSRATVFPTHARDFLEAGVLADAIERQDIEAINPIRCPLDVLAQIIVSMTGVETWNIDHLFAQLKTSYPYRNLSRRQFDLVLDMLAGRYAESRIRELQPRVSIDRLDQTVTARRGALQALYFSGGVIPDRGYFTLRHADSNARIGDLDEEFVWEAKIGQIFALGAQKWKIQKITHNDVIVQSADPKTSGIPFWKAEAFDRDFHFSALIGQFLERAENALDDPEFPNLLKERYRMENGPADELIAFLVSQKGRTGVSLPHRHHLLVETTRSGPGSVPGNQIVLHTLWGGRLNRPFAMALDAAWEKRFRYRLEVIVGDDCVVLVKPGDITPAEVLSLVTAGNVESLIRKRLESSGFFGARFRECAGRSLLITRQRLNQRMPLWMSRLRSQKLFNAVMRYEDFPILLETWRTCLHDEFDLPNLRIVLSELESGEIKWSETRTSHPSPFAQSVAWRQVNEFMYRGDDPKADQSSQLRGDLLREVVFSPDMRPTLPKEIVSEFESKRRRLSPGYSPRSAADLLDWVKERVLLPKGEWLALVSAMQNDHDADVSEWVSSLQGKLLELSPAEGASPLVVAAESAPQSIRDLYGSAEGLRIEPLVLEGMEAASTASNSLALENPSPPSATEEERSDKITNLIGEWLQFYGPISENEIGSKLGIGKSILLETLNSLVDSQRIICGSLIAQDPKTYYCDSENFETLLRLRRAGARPSFQPRPIEELPLFLAAFQGVAQPKDTIDALARTIEQLHGYAAPPELWEKEILPSRLDPYQTSWLDTLMQGGDLLWIGSDSQRVVFCFSADLDLLEEENKPPTEDEEEKGPGTLAEIFSDPAGRYDFPTLQKRSEIPATNLSDRLWSSVWRGEVTNDTFLSLRRGIENKFTVPDLGKTLEKAHHPRRRSSGRAILSRWKSALPFAGNWRLVEQPHLNDDLLERAERDKDRVRVLLDRYGILFRELLLRESPPFRWRNLFRILRLMELSGEVLAGHFFENIPGPQFISHQAFRLLQQGLPETSIYWMNAADPISPCGLQLEALKASLPSRLPGNHLVYRGADLILTSRRNGRDLSIVIAPNDPGLPEALGLFHHLLNRAFQPLPRITIETINQEPAAQSPFLDAFRTSFEVEVDFKKVCLYKKIHRG